MLTQDLNDLIAFVKVVELRSFTAAGKSLDLPNSSISRKVTRLEEDLGVRLLHRTTRKLSLSDAGEVYYERAVRLLLGLEEAENLLSQAQSLPQGRLRVSAPLGLNNSLDFINDFLELFPEVRIELHFSSEAAETPQEDIDVTFLQNQGLTLSPSTHKLFDDEFRLVASPCYLKKRGRPETPSELSEHDAVLLGRSSGNGIWELKDRGNLERFPVHGRFSSNRQEAVLSAVEAGHGIALLPLSRCSGSLNSGRVEEVLKGCAPAPVPLYVTHQDGQVPSPTVRAFVAHAKKHFEDLASRLVLSDKSRS